MFEFDTSEFEKGFSEFLKLWRKEDLNTKKEVGSKFIHDVADGLEGDPTAPPILTGRLRGSGSAFVEGEYKADTKDEYNAGTPATTGAEKEKGVVLVAFNTEYAARWHENPFNPGPVSVMYGNTGPKYVERHLRSDGSALFQLYAKLMSERVNN